MPKGINVTEGNFELIKVMARDFWERITNDERISDEFRAFLERGNPIDLMQINTQEDFSDQGGI